MCYCLSSAVIFWSCNFQIFIEEDLKASFNRNPNFCFCFLGTVLMIQDPLTNSKKLDLWLLAATIV